MTERLCIYCQEVHPKNEEHVLQRSFGAELRLKDQEVCKGCNSYFSAYDTALAHFVRTLSDLRNHPAVNSHDLMFFDGVPSLAFDEPSGLHFAYRHATRSPGQWDRIPFAQLVLRADGRLAYVNDGSRMESDRKLIQKELDGIHGIKLEFVDWRTENNLCPPLPIIVRSSERKYVIVAAESDRQRVLSMLQQGIIAAAFTALNSETAVSSSVEGREFAFRGQYLNPLVPVVKIAFNFACHTLGFDAIQRAEFNWVRRYARFSEPPASDDFAIIFDEKTRAEHLRRFAGMRKLTTYPGHKLLMFARPNMPLGVHIVLYEQFFAFVLLLV